MDMAYMIQGFEASAVDAGLKKNGALDLALIYSEKESTAAGVFTTSRVKAAPVLLSMENIRKGRARAIVTNAGNANACTGSKGMDDARETIEKISRILEIDATDVLVASTGVIGKPIDMPLLSRAIPGLRKNLGSMGMEDVARAIMTTDTFPKMSAYEGRAGERPYRIVGVAKGAGMIMPDMATMLCFLLSDIAIDGPSLQKALFRGVEKTFNRITVDGDTSTNDTVFALANGMAGNVPLSPSDLKEFDAGLVKVMGDLARMIIKDGEGATKFVVLELKGAASASDALKGARTVANSPLVKTAFYGSDPNWGRIMAALGRSGILFEESNTDIWIDDVQIVKGGLGRGQDEEKRAARKMSGDAFTVTVRLGMGEFSETLYTCDLSHEYVTINANYRT
jgi:glutamate N-acetyltransferase / amino-acid N-acetyltransferase